MIFSLLVRFIDPYRHLHDQVVLQNFWFSEFLINFAGGFVRRGALGEILLWFTKVSGIDPVFTIIAISVGAYVVVTWFFLRKFISGGYCWWLVLSPLMCGYVYDIIRRDYLLYIVIIGMLCMVRYAAPALWRRVGAFGLAVCGLMIHEAFIFWGVPVLFLIFIADRGHLKMNMALIFLLLAIFMMLCFFKGDEPTAACIVDSWNSVLDGRPLTLTGNNAIGALMWDMQDTMHIHMVANIIGSGRHFSGILFWLVCYMAVYYFVSFFFVAFKPTKDVFGSREQVCLSGLFLFVTSCMLPMFTVLSCDFGRDFQYLTISAFATYMIVDRSLFVRLIPDKICVMIARFNLSLSRILVPTSGLLVMMLLGIGISPTHYDMELSMLFSPAGSMLRVVSAIITWGLHAFC